jgi:hypothetical protein
MAVEAERTDRRIETLGPQTASGTLVSKHGQHRYATPRLA